MTSSPSPNFHSKVAVDWGEHKWHDKPEILSSDMGYLWLSNDLCLSAGQAQLLYCSCAIFWSMHKRNKLILCYGRKKNNQKTKHQDLIRLVLPDYPAMHGSAEREQWDSLGAWSLPLVQCPLQLSSWISVKCAIFLLILPIWTWKRGLEDHEDDLLFF